LVKRNFASKGLSEPDSYALSCFAMAWAWHKHATIVMSEPGFEPVVTDRIGHQTVNPWFKILNESARVMLSWSHGLYLTPASRAALARPQKGPASKFDGLIGQRTSSPSSNVSSFPLAKDKVAGSA
jgi:phage terminase small subunit